MITGGAVPASRYTITGVSPRRHTATCDFAGTLAPTATAFQHRAEHYDMLILSQWPDATDSQRNIEWTQQLFEAMTPYLEDAVYVNNLGDEGPGRVRAAYGANYERLATLKQSYDPDNIFQANQNIAPLSTSSS